MAKISSVNNIIPSASPVAACFFILKETLKSAGWVVKSSSDGTTYNATADQITTNTTGAGGMNNSRAWFRIQDPGTKREFTFQRGTTVTGSRIKYSAIAKFTGGSPAATVTPSATDEFALQGGGTDASPTFGSLFGFTSETKFHFIAENAAEGDVYGFWAFTTAFIFGVNEHCIILEPLKTGSYPTLDQDPSVTIVSTVTVTTTVLNGISSVRAWYKTNLTGATYQSYAASSPSILSGTAFNMTGSLTKDPYDGLETPLPIGCFRYLNLTGISGATARVNFKGVFHQVKLNHSQRGYPSVYSPLVNSYVHWGNILIPWPDNTVPLI